MLEAPLATQRGPFGDWGRGLIGNLIFAVYALWFEGPIAGAAMRAVHEQQTNIGLGLSIVGLVALEPLLLREKRRQISQRLAAHNGSNDGGWSPGAPLFLWLFHAMVTVVMMGVALFALDPPRLVLYPAALVLIAREGYLLFAVFLEIEFPASRPRVPEALVDAGLVAFQCVAYSTTWHLITGASGPLNERSLGVTLLNAVVAGLLLLMFLVPSRSAHFLEQVLFARTPRRRWLVLSSLVVAVIAGLKPLVLIEDGRWFVSAQRLKQLKHERVRGHD